MNKKQIHNIILSLYDFEIDRFYQKKFEHDEYYITIKFFFTPRKISPLTPKNIEYAVRFNYFVEPQDFGMFEPPDKHLFYGNYTPIQSHDFPALSAIDGQGGIKPLYQSYILDLAKEIAEMVVKTIPK